MLISAVLLLAFREQVLAADIMRQPPSRVLNFFNTHTGERMSVDYRSGFRYHPEDMAKLDHFLRDHRSGREREIDGELLGLLNALRIVLQVRHPGMPIEFQVISGYRSRETNEMLRAAGGAQAKESYHIEGKAMDIRVSGIDLVELRNTAWCLHRGGVGFYRDGNFIHVDTGRIRYWNWRPDSGMCGGHDSYNN